MKKHYKLPFALVIILISISSALQAQRKPLYAGTKTPYTKPFVKYTPAPLGYRPVFVNYVGRHGARFMTKSGADKQALALLDEAAAQQALTTTGRKIRRSVYNMLTIQREGYEKITLLGAEEQKGIGQRIYDQYKTAFSGMGIQVQYTFKVRTQQSADAFLAGYKNYPGAITIEKKSDSSNAILRFYDLSPAYILYKESASVKASLDSLENTAENKEIIRRVCLKIFTTAYANQLIAKGKAAGFVENLYELYAAGFAVTGEMKNRGFNSDSVNLKIAFTEADLKWMDLKAGAADFLEKGPGRDTNGIQVKIAAPLLADFLLITDSAVRNKKTDAVFRFTHAEAISPFASLMEIPAASTSSPGIFQYAKHWQIENIIPLSANIQWILYSNGKKYLIKVLANEKEVRLPIASATVPYYDWEAFRNFYVRKLQSINVRPDTDMLGYLKTVQ